MLGMLIACAVFAACVVGQIVLSSWHPKPLKKREEWLKPIADIEKRRPGKLIAVDFEGEALIRALRESIRREEMKKSPLGSPRGNTRAENKKE